MAAPVALWVAGGSLAQPQVNPRPLGFPPLAALGDIARAKGMSQFAREAGLGRESLYKALSTTGNPELATILKVMRALGLQLHVQAAPT
jgi:hypothetical protein